MINNSTNQLHRLAEFASVTNGKSNTQDSLKIGNYPFYDRSMTIKRSNKFLFDCEAIIVPGEGMTFTPRYTKCKFDLHQRCYCIYNFKNISGKYLYYQLLHKKNYWSSVATGSTVPSLRLVNFLEMPVYLHSPEEQQHIVDILGTLDEQIENNENLIDKLEEKLLLEYDLLSQNTLLEESAMQDCFAISIGKTPPRKESKWFTTNKQDIKWLSISDLGKSKVFCSDSSERLTPEGVSRYNVKIVPQNTVVLSFKLTVGKVAITACEMATNEAIAHFVTPDKYINEYLYCYLKRFNFDSLGNTSSIGTAVNSKTIKAMKFLKPSEEELIDFHNRTSPLMDKIKHLLDTNDKLNELKQLYLQKFFG